VLRPGGHSWRPEVVKQQNYGDVPRLLEQEGARHKVAEILFAPIPTLPILLPKLPTLGYVNYLDMKVLLESAYYYSDAYRQKPQPERVDDEVRTTAIKYLYAHLWPFFCGRACAEDYKGNRGRFRLACRTRLRRSAAPG